VARVTGRGAEAGFAVGAGWLGAGAEAGFAGACRGASTP